MKTGAAGRQKGRELGPLVKITKTIQQIADNKAGRHLSQFVKCIEGESHRSIADKLESTCEKRDNQNIRTLIGLLRKESKCSLGTLIMAANADLGVVIKRYTEASLEMGQNLTMIEFAKAMPLAARDLMRSAAANVGACYTCLGSGKMPGKQAGDKTKEWVPCIACHGKKEVVTYPEHFEYAVDTGLKALKILEPPKGATVNVNQQVGVRVETGGLLEKIATYADQARGPERILDVSPINNTEESGKAREDAGNNP